jgi:hypothetical protein
LLREAMRERGLSFKETLNLAVRRGLGRSLESKPKRARIPTYRMGFDPSYRWDKALAIAAAIEDEELVRKLELRK